MPYVPMPSIVSVPDMKVRDEDPSTWTRQPVTGEQAHVLVTGPAETAALALSEQTAAAHIVNVPMAKSGVGTTVRLRDYQLEAIEAIEDSWNHGAKAPLIVMGTGAGKTIVAAEVMARMYAGSGAKSLFLAHREELLSQTADKVRLVSPETRVGVVQAKTNDLGREVTVASIQTLGHKGGTRMRALLDHGPYQVVVCDEAHHATSPTWGRVLDALKASNPSLLIMGMSVGPDSYIELRGGLFSTGFVGRIEDAWAAATRLVEPYSSHGFDVVDLQGVQARGWTGHGFAWKGCLRLLRHPLGDKPCSAIRVGGRISTVLTDDHAVYVAAGSPGAEPAVSAPSTSDLATGSVLLGDDGAGWQSTSVVDTLDLLAFASAHMGEYRVHVECDVKAIPRSELRAIGFTPQRIYDSRRTASLPLSLFRKLSNIPALGLRVEGSPHSAPPTLAVESMAFVFGVWLGDGWVEWEKERGRGRGRVAFAVANHQLEDFCSALKRMPMVTGVTFSRRNTGSVEVRVSSVFFSALCRHYFGRVTSGTKRIPSEWIVSWSELSRRELLRGLVFSDGSTQEGGRGRLRRQYRTTSPRLAHDVLSLLRSLRISGSLYSQPPREGGLIGGRRIVGRRVSYMVHWSAAAERGDDNGRRGTRNRFDHSRLSFHERALRAVDTVAAARPEHVFDVEMDGHPSFVANGILVHNTATPGRSDGVALDRVFDAVAYEKNLFDLIRDGWLVPPHGFRVDINIDLDKVATEKGDFVVTQLSKLMNTPHVNRAVVEAWRSYGLDRKCLVYACDVAHAHALAQEFNDAGHPAMALDGKTKKKDRKEVLGRFREGALKLLVSCEVLTEGYDDPSAEGIVFARPTQSQGLFAQMLGRGLRLFPGKTECIAEGQRVLTDRGLVPIENVTSDMMVWDGVEFVSHEGAVLRGTKETITYAGLAATPDHQVQTEHGWRSFGECAGKSLAIVRSGDGRRPIRTADCDKRDAVVSQRATAPSGPMLDVRHDWFTRPIAQPDCRSLTLPLLQAKGRVWDLLNCGPRHRFTVEGLLVSNCLVIDCVGNSAKHQPVQLASLAGLDPERQYGGGGLKGDGDHPDFDEAAESDENEVTGANVGEATEVTFAARKPKSQYQWRETTLGWILQVPRVGYYLVAWSDKAKHMATIKFFDQRPGRKHEPPREIVRQPTEFEMAYGLVESEMDRIFRARSMRRSDVAPEDSEYQPEMSFVAIDEGVDEDVVLPEEDLMLKDAGWREKAISSKQRTLLLSLGVKEKTLPETSGEASDLITIMRVERDMKMRVPATVKQINYLRYHNLPLGQNLTKGMAARAIWTHRKATGT